MDGWGLGAPVSSRRCLKKSKEFRVFGVLIQSHNTETLKKFSDEITDVAELLDAEAEPLLEI